MARALAIRLGLDHVSAGDFMRQMAEERQMSILELSRIAEDDATIDREIDARTVRFGRERDGFVIDARLAWHFLPDSVKVFLDVTPDVAAARIFGDARTFELENTDTESTRRAIEARVESERQRYRDYYGVDYLDAAQFDVVVDTSHLTIEQVVDAIAAHVEPVRRLDRPDPTRGQGPL